MNETEIVHRLQQAIGEHARGELEAASAACREVLIAAPHRADAWSLLGVILRRQGQIQQALAAHREAVRRQPDFPEAWNNLANTLRELRQLPEAAECYRQAQRLRPGWMEPGLPLVDVLREAGRLDEAMAAARQAIAADGDHPEPWMLLGNCFQEGGASDQAVVHYQQALNRNPDSAQYHYNLGNALRDLGRLEECLDSYRRALALQPDFVRAESNRLFTLQADPAQTPQSLLEAHLAWDRRHGQPRAGRFPPPAPPREPDKVLNLGLVSADFGQHPVGYFLLPVLPHIDRGRFRLFLYSGRSREDEITARLKAQADGWRAVAPLSDDDLLRLIRQDGIDILLDLSGHTMGNRLPVFAMKPAPLQGTWAGYVGTTGLAAIDFLVTDRFENPPGSEAFVREKLLILPDGYVCYQPPAYAPEVGELPALKNGFITFGCFNNLVKINRKVLDLWGRLLQDLPDARLLLITHQLDMTILRARLKRHFAAMGVAERVMLRGRLPHEELLARYNDIDIALDPFPYSGGLTTLEALWMGVPVVTLGGERFCSRHSISHLSVVGMTDGIATDEATYRQKALELAADRPRLAELRRTLRPRMAASPACDGARLAANLQTGLRRLWQAQCPPPGPPEGSVRAKVEGLREQGRLQEALQASRELPEGSLSALLLRVDLLDRLDRFEEAAGIYGELLRLKPEIPELHHNLGAVRLRQGRVREAIGHLERALSLGLDEATLHANLGNAHLLLGTDLDACARHMALALERRPDDACTAVLLTFVQQKRCDWQGFDTLRQRVVEPALAWQGGGVPPSPFPFLSMPTSLSGAELRQLAARFADWFESRVTPAIHPPATAMPRKLRIGYLSADFHNHPTAHLMLGLFKRHNRHRVTVFAYSLGPDDGSHYRRRIREECENFVDLEKADIAEAVARIRQDGIHILVDLKGYTTDSRMEILAHRPAPLAVAWLGYPGTSGARCIDFILTDRHVTPPDRQADYSERFIYLPNCYQINDRDQPVASEIPLPEECELPSRAFVFCCFNAHYKIDPQTFDCWMAILREVEGSVLWLMEGIHSSRENLRREAQRRGIDPSRLVFAPVWPKERHLARLRLAHLFLDTWIYNAHTTASDALWTGLPVLTRTGHHFPARVAASLLHAAGMGDAGLIVESAEAYRERAIALAQSPRQLQALRSRLERRRPGCPLFNTDAFARDLESAFAEMWRLHIQKGKNAP
ncbi:MAG: tetratricopeptide repeat protein [Magnetococcales bacterium]|nr:tetratricopeptide repeat protein [Magnetococcales bacterium]